MTKGRAVLAFVLGVLCVMPVTYLFGLSFVERWGTTELLPGALTLRWWRSLVGGDLGASLGVSVAVSLLVALVSTVGGFAAARFVAYSPRRRWWLFVAYAPFVLSPVMLGVCLMYLYLRLGLAGHVVGVVAAQTIFALGFSTVFFTAFWTEKVRAYEGLAATLGAGRRLTLARVLLPLARGLLVLCFFQAFLLSWFQYGLTLLVGQGKVQTLPLKVFNYLNEANPYVAALAACLLILPPVVTPRAQPAVGAPSGSRCTVKRQTHGTRLTARVTRASFSAEAAMLETAHGILERPLGAWYVDVRRHSDGAAHFVV